MGAFKSDDLCGFWMKATVAANVPTLVKSFNVTSITDTGTGILTVTIGTDFSSADWCCSANVERAVTTYAATDDRKASVRNATQAAGSVAIDCYDSTATTNVVKDPAAWHVAGFGAQ